MEFLKPFNYMDAIVLILAIAFIVDRVRSTLTVHSIAVMSYFILIAVLTKGMNLTFPPGFFVIILIFWGMLLVKIDELMPEGGYLNIPNSAQVMFKVVFGAFVFLQVVAVTYLIALNWVDYHNWPHVLKTSYSYPYIQACGDFMNEIFNNTFIAGE